MYKTSFLLKYFEEGVVNIKCHWLDDNNAISRLVAEWKEHNGIIIGFDYDNTVYDYNKKGYDFSEIIELLIECKKMGCTLVLHTSCDSGKFQNIRNYLSDVGISIDYINRTPEHIPFGQEVGTKPYCNIYLDDRAGLSSTYNTLNTTLKIIKGEN